MFNFSFSYLTNILISVCIFIYNRYNILAVTLKLVSSAKSTGYATFNIVGVSLK